MIALLCFIAGAIVGTIYLLRLIKWWVDSEDTPYRAQKERGGG